MVLNWYQILYAGRNMGPTPIMVWRIGAAGTPPPPTTGAPTERAFIGQVQQVGSGMSIDTSVGLT